MQLLKERTVIEMGFYLIRGKLQLLQTSVNILYKVHLIMTINELFIYVSCCRFHYI